MILIVNLSINQNKYYARRTITLLREKKKVYRITEIRELESKNYQLKDKREQLRIIIKIYWEIIQIELYKKIILFP